MFGKINLIWELRELTQPNQIRIYVYLEDEGTDVWRPVQALRLEDNLFQIVEENPDPEDEHWQFCTGDVVRCREDYLGTLIAVEKVSSAI